MSALQHRQVADDDVARVLQRDGLVAQPDHGRLFGLEGGGRQRICGPHAQRPVSDMVARPACAGTLPRQADAMDHPRPDDGDVLDVLPPDQAVAPMTVAEVLPGVVGVGFGCVVAAGMPRRIGSLKHATFLQLQGDTTPQPDREAEVAPRGQQHPPPAGVCRCSDRGIDGGGVERRAIPERAEIPHAEHPILCHGISPRRL